MVVYKATRIENEQVYVGITSQELNSRLNAHYCYSLYYFGAALRKYGREAFTFEVIDFAENRYDLGEKEKYWIKFYDCMAPKGYNLTSGGECGYERSEDTKKRMSESRLAFFLTPEGEEYKKALSVRLTARVVLQETKDKIAASLKNNPLVGLSWKGKKRGPMSQEQKDTISASLKGWVNVGRKRPDLAENSRKWAASPDYVNPMKGKKRPDLAARNKSPEMRERTRQMGLANKGKGGPKKRTALTLADLPAVDAESRQAAKDSLAAFLKYANTQRPVEPDYTAYSFVESTSIELFGIPAWMQTPAPPMEQLSLF